MTIEDVREVLGKGFESAPDKILNILRGFPAFQEAVVDPFSATDLQIFSWHLRSASRDVKVTATLVHNGGGRVTASVSRLDRSAYERSGVVVLKGKVGDGETWIIAHKTGRVFYGVQEEGVHG